MAHSNAVTAAILASPDPVAARNEMWARCRYLVAQQVKTETWSGTDQEHYIGRAIVPGPKADPQLVPLMAEQDPDVLQNKYGITFVDFTTTEGADNSVVSAPYTIMSNAEADDYELQLRKQLGIKAKPVPKED